MDALISLGFDQGLIGQLGEVGRLLGIVDATLANNAMLPPLLRVPAATISRLANWKSVHDANEEIANGGPREVLTAQKDAASDLLYARIARVRLYLCSCSDAGEYDHALARYGFQPKRDSGDAQPQDKPDAAGVVAWDAVTRLLSLPALPLHATSLVAWRQPLGGTAEPCGMSETESVNAAETSPFVPGATYDLWVTGRNSVGDGMASNKIRWTVPL